MKKLLLIFITFCFMLSFIDKGQTQSLCKSLNGRAISLSEIVGEWSICFTVKELDNDRRRKTTFTVFPRIQFETSGAGKIILATNNEEPFKFKLRNDTIDFYYTSNSEGFLNGTQFIIKIDTKKEFKELELRTVKGDFYYILRKDIVR